MLHNNEHGYCPNCNADLDGGLVWEHFFKESGSEEKADATAALYGATRTTGKWGRAIGINCMDRDRIVGWVCPDCKHEWGSK